MNRNLLALTVLFGACLSGPPAAEDTGDDPAEVSDTPHDSQSSDVSEDPQDLENSDAVEEVEDWPTSPRLVVDGVEGAVRSGESGTQTIARAVGDDLYVEVQWSITSPSSGYMRVGLRVDGAARNDVAVSLGDDGLEVFGVEYMLQRPLTWARLFANDPRPTGRIRVQHTDETTTLWLELQASLTVLGAQPREPMLLVLEDRVELDVETRSTYAGTCSFAPKAFYIPLQVGSYEASFFAWEAVENDCRRNPSTSCGQTGAGGCGDGDRWLCYQCFADACVQPAWISECFPP